MSARPSRATQESTAPAMAVRQNRRRRKNASFVTDGHSMSPTVRLVSPARKEMPTLVDSAGISTEGDQRPPPTRTERFTHEMRDDKVREDYIKTVDSHVDKLLDAVRAKETIRNKGRRGAKAPPLSADAREKKKRLVDISTSDSPLTHVNLKSLINATNFASLPHYYQYKLTLLLPRCDQSIRPDMGWCCPSKSAFSNEFFTKASQDWSERLKEGRLAADHVQKKAVEAEKEHARLDPWKKANFEPIWGIKHLESRQHERESRVPPRVVPLVGASRPPSAAMGRPPSSASTASTSTAPSRSSSSCSTRLDEEYRPPSRTTSRPSSASSPQFTIPRPLPLTPKRSPVAKLSPVRHPVKQVKNIVIKPVIKRTPLRTTRNSNAIKQSHVEPVVSLPEIPVAVEAPPVQVTIVSTPEVESSPMDTSPSDTVDSTPSHDDEPVPKRMRIESPVNVPPQVTLPQCPPLPPSITITPPPPTSLSAMVSSVSRALHRQPEVLPRMGKETVGNLIESLVGIEMDNSQRLRPSLTIRSPTMELLQRSPQKSPRLRRSPTPRAFVGEPSLRFNESPTKTSPKKNLKKRSLSPAFNSLGIDEQRSQLICKNAVAQSANNKLFYVSNQGTIQPVATEEDDQPVSPPSTAAAMISLPEGLAARALIDLPRGLPEGLELTATNIAMATSSPQQFTPSVGSRIDSVIAACLPKNLEVHEVSDQRILSNILSSTNYVVSSADDHSSMGNLSFKLPPGVTLEPTASNQVPVITKTESSSTMGSAQAPVWQIVPASTAMSGGSPSTVIALPVGGHAPMSPLAHHNHVQHVTVSCPTGIFDGHNHPVTVSGHHGQPLQMQYCQDLPRLPSQITLIPLGPPSGQAIGGGHRQQQSAVVSNNNDCGHGGGECPCGLKPWVQCAKCSAFCHSDCLGPSNLCESCLASLRSFMHSMPTVITNNGAACPQATYFCSPQPFGLDLARN